MTQAFLALTFITIILSCNSSVDKNSILAIDTSQQRISQQTTDNYFKSDLFRQHCSNAFTIEKMIRTKSINEIKRYFPKLNEQSRLFKDIDSSQKYFPKCTPSDTLIHASTKLFLDKYYTTEIKFWYDCPKQKEKKNFSYNITFVFHWDNDETIDWEVLFSEEEVSEDFPETVPPPIDK